ncbi:MAG: 16S rRNA (guanine(527)-N(7))-methyltransferase RsmG [Pyrinomonadaceae bacterium]
MSTDFIAAIKANQAAFSIDLPDGAIERLADYYDLIQEHNPILHLVGPMTDEEFAIRHILESLTMLDHLPHGTKFADIGSGGGLPAIPCLLVREDLRAVLIESKEKKAKFLENAVDTLGLKERVSVVNRQFAEIAPGNCTTVTCRALDKFTERLSQLVKWSIRRHVLFFGNEKLGKNLQEIGLIVVPRLMPMSEQRYLFVARR